MEVLRRGHNEKYIKQTTKDADPLSNRRHQGRTGWHTYISEIRMVKRTVFSIVAFFVVLIILLPTTFTYAGGLTSFLDIFTNATSTNKPESITNITYSALSTPLLSATLSPVTQNSAVGGGSVTVENNTLVSTGPVGDDEIAAANNGTGEISVYVVREGDSLSQIAEMYGVTTNTILWANDLTSAASIQPGDTLVILPIAGVQHKVVTGETLSTIVKKYGANMQEVLDYNNLTSTDDLLVGDELLIPGGEIAVTKNRSARKRSITPTPTKTSGSIASGGLSHPAPGAIKTQGIHGYNAVDLGSPGGILMPIRAAAAGEVILSKASGWNGGYGQYIVIRHPNGMQTLYSHLSRNDVGVGAYVSQGQQIGVMGSTGRSTGVHLHFEVRGGRNPF